jgi:alkyl sulfatase BDS1-like metallo-beta-lactamase superfamily hydrolase
MEPPDALSAEVRAMLDAMAPAAKTAIGRISANARVIRAAQRAMARGDYEMANELLEQPYGSVPLQGEDDEHDPKSWPGNG